jgi:hypothetical protein
MNEDIVQHGEDFLAHHGILGQRWGVRRYQNEDGTLTTAGKIRYGATKKEGIIKSIIQKTSGKSGKIVKSAGKKMEDYTEDIEKFKDDFGFNQSEQERLKAHLRNKPKDIYKYRNALSQDDINEVMKQVEWDRKCKDFSAAEHQRTMKKIQNLTDDIKTIGGLLSSSASTYNNTAHIVNALYDNMDRNDIDNGLTPKKRKRWLIVGQNKNQDKKKDN